MANISKTNDYDQFEFFVENRTTHKINYLLNSIKKRNMLEFHPIHVTPNKKTGKLLIIDGQHRLLCARELNVPIYYTMDINGDVKNIPLLNSNMKVWTSKNYARFFDKLGVDEYKFIQDMVEKYNFPTFTIIRWCCSSKDLKKTKSTLVDEYKNGRIALRDTKNNLEEKIKNIREILDFSKKNLGIKSATMQVSCALFMIMKDEKYNQKIMMEAIKNHCEIFSSLFRFKNVKEISINIIEKVYNAKKSKNKLKIPYDINE